MAYGKTETWKVVYFPQQLDAGKRGVAFVEAESRQQALHIFQEEYSGQFHTVEKCEKLFS
jgi:hypothetical protein